MKSLNKGLVIVVTIVVLALAAFSFKKYILDSGNIDDAKAAMEQKVHSPEASKTVQSTHEMPSNEGIHQPPGKGHPGATY